MNANEPECVGMFTNVHLLTLVVKVIAEVPSLCIVIYDDQTPESVISKIKTVREGDSPLA
jgi:long-chain acyl-CoA synthetase